METQPRTEAEDTEATLDELERVVRWSEEFTLAFVKCNHAAQCDAMRQAVLNRVKDRSILEVELDRPIVSLLDEIKRRWGKKAVPDAVSVLGLEKSINEQRETSKILGSLNHERELLRRFIPGALLIWLPDFALDLVARSAPDFWAWRSGVYEFPTQSELWQQDSNAALSGDIGNELMSLPIEEKRTEIARLDVLLRTARALSDQNLNTKATISRLLGKLGVLHYSLGDLRAAKQCYEEGLAAAREIDDRRNEALNLQRLGVIASAQGEMSDARHLYRKSMEIDKTLGNERNVASALHNLGIIAQEENNLDQARKLYEQSLETNRRISYPSGVARSLDQLGRITHQQGNLDEAQRLYEESLAIAKGIGDQSSVASVLHQLGRIAQQKGDLLEAQRYYEQSLEIDRKLGNQRAIAVSLHQLGLIAQAEHRREDSSALFREALNIFEKIKSPNAEITRQNLHKLKLQQ